MEQKPVLDSKSSENQLMRIQLRRARGWRMPPNTVKVDRSTRWGNPFIVGTQGSAIMCVYWYGLLLGGYLNLSAGHACCDRQEKALKVLQAQAPRYTALRGKNIACWCPIGTPCHGDLLLLVANRTKRIPFDLEAFLRNYGWRVVNGVAERIEEAA